MPRHVERERRALKQQIDERGDADQQQRREDRRRAVTRLPPVMKPTNSSGVTDQSGDADDADRQRRRQHKRQRALPDQADDARQQRHDAEQTPPAI